MKKITIQYQDYYIFNLGPYILNNADINFILNYDLNTLNMNY